MKSLYNKLILYFILIIVGSIVGYFVIIPFVINHFFIPIQAYESHSIYNDLKKNNSIDEDFTYFDNLGNKIIIWDFKKNISEIEPSFFKENLSGKVFYESSDSLNDKFEFKIVEFDKIDSLIYKIRVRKTKILNDKEINSNNRKHLNYFLELERIDNKLKIKRCDLINIELE
jgi:hypothetical protein